MISKEPFTPAQEIKFLEWIRKQPSVLSGRAPCQACHVLSVAHGAGKAFKPRLFAVPMTSEEHITQTNLGYLRAIMKHGSFELMSEITSCAGDRLKSGLHWFKARALEYRNRFLREIGA